MSMNLSRRSFMKGAAAASLAVAASTMLTERVYQHCTDRLSS